MGGFSFLYFVARIMLAEKIERRLSARLQYRDPLPKLGEAKVADEVERRVSQR